MKKNTIITILILGVGLGVYSWSNYKSLKSDYNLRVQHVDLARLGGMDKAVLWLDNCFSISGYNLHNQLVTMVPEYTYNKGGKTFLQLYFPDSLNRCKHILCYVPLYNRETKKKESFILISAGIDGKLNSNYSRGDTIYDDEYLNKFEFYNLKEYSERKSMEFSIWKYLFGKKDYLVRYYNCIEEGHSMPQTLEYYNYRLHQPEPLNSMSVIASFEKDTIVDNKSTIILKSWMDGYKAFCKMHNPITKKFNTGDTLMISGYLEKTDEKMNFHLTHCTMSNGVASYSFNEILKLSKLDKQELEKREKLIGK